MLNFIKVPPTTYVLQYKHGKIKREGAGLSFFYYAPSSTIVTIPLASADVPFVFQETTADFQAVTLQGQLTYRVVDPKGLASLLDFSDNRRSYYAADRSARESDDCGPDPSVWSAAKSSRYSSWRSAEGSTPSCSARFSRAR